MVAPIDDRGEVILEEFERRLSERTRLAAVAHVSNALGTVNPVRRMVELAHARGVPVLVDGAQGAPHLPVDVQELGCDFYVFSGHKVYGPTGIGVLYGRQELLEAMPPYQTGGGMIRSVSFERTVYDAPPSRFEAGTPAVAEAVGLAAALDLVDQIGRPAIAALSSSRSASTRSSSTPTSCGASWSHSRTRMSSPSTPRGAASSTTAATHPPPACTSPSASARS